MNREEALKILGFNPSDDPSEREITIAYRKLALKYHPDKRSSASKDVQKQNEEKFKQLGAAYKFLTEKGTEEVTNLTDENLDEINSPEDLRFYLLEALLEGNAVFLKKLFSKFKSSEDGKFGDYINDTTYANPALILAVIKGGNIEIIKLLLEHGANCNMQDRYGHTALYWACGIGYDKIIELLLEHDANPNIQSKDGDTALFAHIMHGLSRGMYSRITGLLLKYNADPNIKNKGNKTALYWACCRGDDKVVELLLKYGAYPNVQDEDGDIPLHIASFLRHDGVVELLLRHGADPNIQDKHGKFPLHVVSFLGYDGIVELLLKYNANPNVQDRDGEFPLHRALLLWRYSTAELLLKNGANLNVPDQNGKFPLDIARLVGRNDIVQLLLRNGASPDFKDKDDKKPILPRSDGGKPFNSKKAFWLGVATLLATAGSIALISGVADAYIGKVWCSALAAAMAAVALCCTYCAIKIMFFSKPSPEFAEVITEKVVEPNTEKNSQEIIVH